MKTLYALVCLAFCLSFNSCGDPDTDIELNFKLKYEDQPLVFFKDYTYPTGERFQFKRISFFLSDITTNPQNSESTNIREVDYLDLTSSHLSEEAANEGHTITIKDTGVESFSGISFNIGLTEDQNSQVPEDFVSSNPLSDAAEYWRGWESYIFFKIEGSIDINGDGEYGSGEAFQLHLGTDDSMRKFSGGTENSSEITIAVDKIFSYDGMTYDLIANPRLHSLTPEILESMDFLATGISGAFEAK